MSETTVTENSSKSRTKPSHVHDQGQVGGGNSSMKPRYQNLSGSGDAYRKNRDQRRNALRARKDMGRRKAGFKGSKRGEEEADFESKVIEVRRVTRVVKGGKRMRFSALVVVGDKKGRIGIGLKKGADYQDSVAKATRKAKNSLISVDINDAGTLGFTSYTKHKSCEIFLKPARSGTGLIAGGFVRPVLELAGVRNVYSKITRSRNKIAGTQAVFHALEKYTKKFNNKANSQI